MQRINTITKAINLFGAGKHGYKPGNPATNDPATTLSAEALNALQEEVARVVEASGVALNPASFTQLLTAIQALISNRNMSGLIRSLTPLGGGLVREWADTVADTTGNIEFGISYNCAVDPVSGVWAGRDVADICWLERWSDLGGQKEIWYAPTAAAGAAPAWVRAYNLNAATGAVSAGLATLPTHLLRQDQAYGIAQTWQNLTATRALGVTYINSTGKPIAINVVCSTVTAGTGTITLSINGAGAFVIANGNNTAGSYSMAGGAVIPVGATYQVTSTVGLTSFHELR